MIGLGGVSCARAPYTKTNMLRATRYTRFACYKVHKGYSCVQHVPQGVSATCTAGRGKPKETEAEARARDKETKRQRSGTRHG